VLNEARSKAFVVLSDANSASRLNDQEAIRERKRRTDRGIWGSEALPNPRMKPLRGVLLRYVGDKE
jgi:hypothetical protein